MKEITLIYPHQLYEPHPAVAKDHLHILIEDPHFFGDPANPIKFHKQKLMLHRASMRYYAREVLEKRGFQIAYLAHKECAVFFTLLERLRQEGVTTINVVDPLDHVLEERIRQFCEAHGFHLLVYEAPNFLTPKIEVDRYFAAYRTARFKEFYAWQRARMGLLLDEKGRPRGGKWHYKSSRVQPPPPPGTAPSLRRFRARPYVDEARAYVENNYPDNPGSTVDFAYPISAAEAREWFDDFLEKRLARFSAYHHAIAADDPFLYRAVLSSSLNIGLISPQYVLERLDRFLHTHPLPLENVEAFVSRLVGMREYTRAVYLNMGNRQRKTNYFMHAHRLSPMWHGGRTSLPPLDDTLHKLARYAYCSMSERLMVVGNLMLLCETHPDEVYRFFMEMFIDAYDWAVVPNVYGFSQHAEGGLMAASPHLSCADELLRLSDYRAGPWCTIWDGLYWRFVDQHRILFGRSKVLKSVVSRCKKIPGPQFKKLRHVAEAFIKRATL